MGNTLKPIAVVLVMLAVGLGLFVALAYIAYKNPPQTTTITGIITKMEQESTSKPSAIYDYITVGGKSYAIDPKQYAVLKVGDKVQITTGNGIDVTRK